MWDSCRRQSNRALDCLILLLRLLLPLLLHALSDCCSI
jgi:hypothetical protein